MKLWVDDERDPPDNTWIVCRTSADAMHWLWMQADALEEIALDHDLGGDDDTRVIARWLSETELWPPVVRVLTQNPVGRAYLEGMAERYGPGVTR